MTNMICAEERNTFDSPIKRSYVGVQKKEYDDDQWVKITRVEDIRPAKSNRSEDDVPAKEEQVGDAEGGQQVVEHVVHLPIKARVKHV